MMMMKLAFLQFGDRSFGVVRPPTLRNNLSPDLTQLDLLYDSDSRRRRFYLGSGSKVQCESALNCTLTFLLDYLLNAR